MKKIVLLILFVNFSLFLQAQILITAAQVNAINTAQSAASGDVYKDTENEIFYIGTSSGTLKVIGNISKVDPSLAGDGSLANPLRIAPMGAAPGQVLSWNGTGWVPINAAAVANASTTTLGILQLTGDFSGNAYWPVIAEGAVVTSRLADNAVNSSKIADYSIQTDDLAHGSITTDKILDGTITAIDIGANQITYPKIQNVTAQSILGNPTGSTAIPSEIFLGSGLSFTGNVLNTTNNSTTVSNSFNAIQLTTTVNGVSASPVSLPVSNVTDLGVIQLTGDLSGNAYWPVIGNSRITYPKIQNVTAQRLIGNPTTSAAAPSEIVLGTGLSFSGNVLNATGAGWSLTGNAGTAPATNFLGTTDNQRLVFRTNNLERATILTNGNLGVGLAAPDATVHNNGSSINSVRAISNKPTGGNIETAANSVDIGSTFSINQTTAGQTLTIPSPTVTTAGRMIKVSNVGTASFKIANIVLAPSKYADFLWTGSAWIPAVAEQASTLTNKTFVLSAEYAGAVLVPGSGVNHKGDMIGGNTGAVLPYYMNYYEWKGRSAGSQTYQVIVRITLPNDFTEWQTSAMNVTHMVNNSACNISFVLINTSTNTTFYTSPTLNTTSWTTNVINNTSLASWITPGQTVAMVITFSATNGNVARFGDIVLNYK